MLTSLGCRNWVTNLTSPTSATECLESPYLNDRTKQQSPYLFLKDSDSMRNEWEHVEKYFQLLFQCTVNHRLMQCELSTSFHLQCHLSKLDKKSKFSRVRLKTFESRLYRRFYRFCRLQWCWWQRYVGDLRMLIVSAWNFQVAEPRLFVKNNLGYYIYVSDVFNVGQLYFKSVTDISNLPPTKSILIHEFGSILWMHSKVAQSFT